MEIIDQTPERLVFSPAPQAQFDKSIVIFCGPWVLFGLILFSVGLISSFDGKGYAAIGVGAASLATGVGLWAYEFYRHQASQRAYSFDRTVQELRIWGWQPLNYGDQPQYHRMIQALSKPTLRRIPLTRVHCQGPWSYQTSTPFTARLFTRWAIALVASDIRLTLNFDSSEHAQKAKALLASYLT